MLAGRRRNLRGPCDRRCCAAESLGDPIWSLFSVDDEANTTDVPFEPSDGWTITLIGDDAGGGMIDASYRRQIATLPHSVVAQEPLLSNKATSTYAPVDSKYRSARAGSEVNKTASACRTNTVPCSTSTGSA
jgi:hypothetical protein